MSMSGPGIPTLKAGLENGGGSNTQKKLIKDAGLIKDKTANIPLPRQFALTYQTQFTQIQPCCPFYISQNKFNTF